MRVIKCMALRFVTVSIMISSAGAAYGQQTNAGFGGFMNRIGNSIQNTIAPNRNNTDDPASAENQSQVSPRDARANASSPPKSKDVWDNSESTPIFPIPPLPSYVTNTMPMAIEKAPAFPRVALWGVYLGMDVEKNPIEEAVKNNMNGAEGLRLAKLDENSYALIPRRRINSDGAEDVFASYAIKNGQVSSIESTSEYWGVPALNTPGITRNTINGVFNARFGIEFDNVGQPKSDGPQIEYEMNTVRIYLPKAKGDEFITAENTRIYDYYDKAFPMLTQSYLGVYLGESLKSVLAKCAARGITVETEDSYAQGDKYGIPDRIVKIKGSLADVEVCNMTDYHFQLDKLAKIYCMGINEKFSDSIAEKYGKGHGEINVIIDGKKVRISSSWQDVSYAYDDFIQAADQYRRALEETIKATDDIRRRNLFKNLDY